MNKQDQPHSANSNIESTITIEDVAQQPLPGTVVPQKLAFSPDDQWITYLLGNQNDMTHQLYALASDESKHQLMVSLEDSGSTETSFSVEEQLRRERQRQLQEGISDYTWSHQDNCFLLPLNGNIYVQNGVGSSLRKLVDNTEKPALDARFSPDDQWVAYVQDSEIYIVSKDGGGPQQLTQGARGTGKTNGLADFIAQEEMNRPYGYWWSPDSKYIAFTEIDETHIPEFRIMHLGKDITGEDAQENHRYPFAGKANPRFRLGVIDIEDGSVVWMDLGNQQEIYLARVQWMPNGQLSAQIQNRAQTKLDFIFLDPQTGHHQTILQETSEYWIDIHDLFKPLKENRFIWGSQRTGYYHLYLHDQSGTLIRPLTHGEWMVIELLGVDETQEKIYFTANYEGTGEEHLYVTSFDGETPRQITREAGMHSVVLDHALKRFIDVHHSITTSPHIRLCSLEDGTEQKILYDEPDSRLDKLALIPPEMLSIKNRDGITLHGALYRPPENFGTGPFPTVISFYGGPSLTRSFVSNSWGMTVDLRAQYLSRQGILVFKLDNQGTGRRGIAFTGAIKNDMGNIEVRDQVDGVNYLLDQKLAIPGRIGVYGWSYGGYLSAMCLARASETFNVAVSGAPVTHQDGYDTHYTERIMGTPESNPKGYLESSVMNHVNKIKGKLLLVHGLMDENVHFRHTARLINALIAARKPYDLLVFPDGRHSLRKPADRLYLEERVCDYFKQHL